MLTDLPSRLANYYKRHGSAATLERMRVSMRRMVSHRLVLFYCDLPERIVDTASWPDHLAVKRTTAQTGIDRSDWQKISSFWNPDLSQRKFYERFREGATVWLIYSSGKLAGYGWTLTGRSIRPHFFPFGAEDVHLFDFLVFPEYRGQGINPFLVGYILNEVASEHRMRAYIEAAEWNHSQLTSLRKTGFRLLGVASKTTLFRRTFVAWQKDIGQPASNDKKVQLPVKSS